MRLEGLAEIRGSTDAVLLVLLYYKVIILGVAVGVLCVVPADGG
jgi:hypothetical protein